MAVTLAPKRWSMAGTATFTTYASYEATPDASTVAAISARPVALRSGASDPASVAGSDSDAVTELIALPAPADAPRRSRPRGHAGPQRRSPRTSEMAGSCRGER